MDTRQFYLASIRNEGKETERYSPFARVKCTIYFFSNLKSIKIIRNPLCSAFEPIKMQLNPFY